MTARPFAPKMTEAQRQEAMRRYKRGDPDIIVPGRTLIIDATTPACLDPQRKSEIRRHQKGCEFELWRLFIGKEAPGTRCRYADELLEEKRNPPIAEKIGLELLLTFRSPTYREELTAVLSRHHTDTVQKYSGSIENACEQAGVPFQRLAKPQRSLRKGTAR